MRITVLGTRGIPDILGGVESHCEELYPRIIKNGKLNILLIRRTSYIRQPLNRYKGIRLIDIYSPKIKSLEAIVHTFLGIIYARLNKTKILHIHAIGPAILIPFAKLLGLKVVMTHHGPDYDRLKWGKVAKWILQKGEKFGVKYADKVIVISNVIKSLIKEKYNREDCELIYNGVSFPKLDIESDYLDTLNLVSKKYIIAVGRFVEEKGFHDLINAFYELNQKEYKLVLVGDADHKTRYSQELKKLALDKGIIMSGFIKGRELNQIFSHAALFVMPSYHEGLPIALLEAMSYNLDILVSDIPANIEVNLEVSDYFSTANIPDLVDKLSEKLKGVQKRDFSTIIKEKYNWDKIALQTINVYDQILIGT